MQLHTTFSRVAAALCLAAPSTALAGPTRTATGPYNAVIDRARRSRIQISFEDALAHPNVDQIIEPDATILALSDKEAVRGALAKLTPLQQEVIVLRFVEGYSTQEIATLVGKREGTVRGIQFRALEALRTLIPSREALA